VLAGLTALTFAATVFLVGTAPVEEQMGIVQKIFYFHVPSAYCMYVGYTFAAVGGLMYLFKRTDGWDAVSLAGAEIGTLFCVIVLVTGPLWGRKAWGVYWVWDPRLTSTLLTGMIYLSFLGLRMGRAGDVEKRFAAVLAMIGFPMLFLVKYSVRRWSGQHPMVISGNGGGISSDMLPALATSFVAFTFLIAWLLWTRIRIERQRQKIWSLELDLAREGFPESEEGYE
jgi:heme exporter protein C